MSITIRYFASLKENIGRSEETLPYPGQISVRDVWSMANPNRPLPDNLLAAINMDYVDLDSVVQEGDEVAFFPPVTGG